jgi:uncharacterized membrane protein YdjX (TVP38/TMEM64 family)
VPALPLTMTAGALFGVIPGTIAASVAGTVAATGAFVAARYFLRQKVFVPISSSLHSSCVGTWPLAALASVSHASVRWTANAGREHQMLSRLCQAVAAVVHCAVLWPLTHTHTLHTQTTTQVVDWAEQNPKFKAIDAAIADEGLKIVVLLRLSPLLPLSLSNYLYGLTSLELRPYVLGSWLGMLPGTFLYVQTGAVRCQPRLPVQKLVRCGLVTCGPLDCTSILPFYPGSIVTLPHLTHALVVEQSPRRARPVYIRSCLDDYPLAKRIFHAPRDTTHTLFASHVAGTRRCVMAQVGMAVMGGGDLMEGGGSVLPLLAGLGMSCLTAFYVTKVASKAVAELDGKADDRS